MAVVGTNLTADFTETPATSFVTASVSPASNALIVVSVTSRTGISTEPNQPTVSGCGLTWVVIGPSSYWDTTSSSRKKSTCFCGMGASPSAGAITISFGGQEQTNGNWSVDQFTGVDTSGTNGSGAVGGTGGTNIAHNEVGPDVGSITVTLGSFSSANNVTFGFITSDSWTGTSSAGSGFTILGHPDDSAGTRCLTEWKSTNDTTVDGSFDNTSGNQAGGIAFEINAAAVAATSRILGGLLMMGMGN